MFTRNELLNGGNGANAGLPKIDSIFRLIVVAGLRSRQLVRGSQPRIVADPLKKRNTSIALEEVRQGLVSFTIRPLAPSTNGGVNGDINKTSNR
jgi:DNA-directed RNA polymerase omega subunit